MNVHRAALTLLALACSRGAPAEELPGQGAREDSAALPISSRKLDGPALVSWLGEPTRRVRVVNFWATWCQPCIAEMPALREFARRNRSSADLVFVNVDVAAAQEGRVPATVRRLSLAGFDHVLLDARDPNAELRHHLKDWTERIPLTLVIAPDGTIVDRFVEAVHGPELEEALRRASAHVTPDPG